jgi:UDP-glucose 4-epimerase
MKVVVTGALGFVGSNLVDLLISEGHDVFGIDNLSSSSSSLYYKNPKVKYFLGSFLDPLAWKGDFEVVYHLGANARIQPSFDNPFETYKNNALGLAYVAEEARKRNAKLIFSSTSSSLHGDYVSPYTQSKRAGEEYLKMLANCYDVDCASARFFNVYGNREPISGDYATVVAKFGRQWFNGDPMTVVGDGTQSRDFTHVSDICRGLLAITEEKRSGEIINLGRGNPYSIMDLVRMYAGEGALEGKDYVFVPLRKNEGQATKWTESVKLNWEAKIDLPDYINSLKKLRLNPDSSPAIS